MIQINSEDLPFIKIEFGGVWKLEKYVEISH